jgi:hypothetical protein
MGLRRMTNVETLDRISPPVPATIIECASHRRAMKGVQPAGWSGRAWRGKRGGKNEDRAQTLAQVAS